jgi:hypothetical protein
VTAWSLGMQMGVDVVFVKSPLADSARLGKLADVPKLIGEVEAAGKEYMFDYKGASSALAINRLVKEGAQVEFTVSGNTRKGVVQPRIFVSKVSRQKFEGLARELGLSVRTGDYRVAKDTESGPNLRRVDNNFFVSAPLRAPRIGLYQPWTANMDEGWTRWVLEQHEFAYTTIHNADVKAGKLRERFDAVILPDQQPRDIVEGYNFKTIRPEYRGGIGDDGVEALREFVREGGTLITLGTSSDLAIEKFPIPVRNLKRGLTREQHFAPGSIVRVQVDTTHAIGLGMAAEAYGFYNNSPFFALVEGFSSQQASVVARYPNTEVLASGWLKGEDFMAGRAAVVSVEMNPGRIVLFGLRPQHRAQTHATFPLLFNSLYRAAFEPVAIR